MTRIKSLTNSLTMPVEGRGVDVTYELIPPPCYTLTLTSGANGGLATALPLKSDACTTNGQYVEGEGIALTSAPDVSYRVASWTGTDNDGSKASTNVLHMPGGNRTVNVTYELIPPPSKVVMLWYAYNTGGAEETALMQVIANAETADPDLDIVPIWHDFNTLYTDYEAAVAAGGGPDMFVGPNDSLGNEARAGQLLNLDSYLAGNLTNVTQTGIDGMKVGGSLYGVPEFAKIVALFYNKSKVSTPPTTTSELLSLLQDGKKLAVPNGAAYYLYGFWHAFGGQLMDVNGYCTADQGGFVPALQYFRDLQTAGASLLNPDDARNSFVNGNVDLYVNGTWMLSDLEAAMGSDLGVVALPAGPVADAMAMNGIDGFYVNPNSTHPAEVVAAALAMTNQASAQIFTNIGGHVPVRTDVSSSDPLNTAFGQFSAQGEPRPQLPQLDNYWGNFGNLIGHVLSGSTSPADGVPTACWNMNRQNGYRGTFYLKASAEENWVHAYGWADGTLLTLKVGDPDVPDFTTMTRAGAAPWDTVSSGGRCSRRVYPGL